MRKLLFISLLLSLLGFNISAQELTEQTTDSVETVKEKKFGLNTYYTPDIVRNKFIISVSANGKNTSLNNNFNNNDSISPIETVTSNSSSYLNGTFNGAFESLTSTRKRISLLQINGNITGNTTGVTNDKTVKINTSEVTNNSTTTDNYNNEILSFNYINRFYNAKKQYLILGVYAGFEANSTNNTSKIDTVKTENSQNGSKFYAVPSVGVGMGRIESVEDARQALYIIEELGKKGALKRELTEEEKFSLAQQISLIKNKRFFDSRVQLMEEIATIDSFFASNNLLNNADVSYYTTLYDNWLYGAAFERKAGQMFEVCLSPSGTWKKDKIITDTGWNNTSTTSFGGDLTVSYLLEKPISLALQHSINARVKVFTEYPNVQDSYSSNVMESIVKSNNSGANIYAGYTLGYYPNSRTYLTAGVSQEIILSFQKDINTGIDSSGSGLFDASIWDRNTNLNSALNLTAYYYVSPQMRLTTVATIGNYYYTNKFKNSDLKITNNSLQSNFSVNLSYTFF